MSDEREHPAHFSVKPAMKLSSPFALPWRRIALILAFLVLLAPSLALAKHVKAAKVEPVIYEGIHYVAPNDNGRRGYIQAWDTKTETKLWELTVYRNFINPFLEEDVQWVFIRKLSIEDGRLKVVDERDREYGVNLKTRVVKRLK